MNENKTKKKKKNKEWEEFCVARSKNEHRGRQLSFVGLRKNPYLDLRVGAAYMAESF